MHQGLRIMLPIGASGLLLIALAAAALGQEEGSQADTEGHPLVGAWIGDGTPAVPDDPLELYVFNEDGTFHGTTNFGPAVGTWAPAGERAYDLTFALRLEGAEGLATVRASGQVSEDGQSVNATYTVQFPPGGVFPEGELGLADFTAQRIELEPMGEPVGPLELPPTDAAAASPAVSADGTAPEASPLPSPGA